MISKLEEKIDLDVLTFAFIAINKLSPIYFHSYFTPNSSTDGFGTRLATRGDELLSLKRNNVLYELKTVQHLALNWGILFQFSEVLLVLFQILL